MLIQDLEEHGKEILLSNDAKIKWHNNMVEAHFAATSREMRMLIALSAHIDKNGDDFEYCVVSAKDLGAVMNLDPHGAYKILKDIVAKLFTKPIVFKSIDKNKEGQPKKVDYYHIFYRLTYDNDNCSIGYQFSPAVKPLLLQVKSAYVETSIDVLMRFKCAYSSRIYLYIVRWSKLGTYTISMRDLREQFGLGNTYSLYSDFKRFVVEPALAEINAFSKYNVRAEFIKTGRKYTHVKFDVSVKAGENPPIDTTATPQVPQKKAKPKKQDEPKLTEQQMAACKTLEQAGITDADFIKKIITFRSLEYITANYSYCYKKYKEGSVKNLGAYLRQALEKNYAQYNQNIPQKNDEKKEDIGSVEPVSPSAPSIPKPEDMTKSDKDKERAELIKKEKDIKYDLLDELRLMGCGLQETTLNEIKDAVRNEYRPDVKGRYLDILDMDTYDIGDSDKGKIIASYWYRMRYPDANPIVEPDFKAPEVPPEVNKAFKKVNELAAHMGMPK